MIQFNAIFNGVMPSESEHLPHSVEGHKALKETEFPVVVSGVDFLLICKFSEQQTVNFIALLAKCWHHLSFMRGLPTESANPANPWPTFKQGGISAVYEQQHQQDGALRVFEAEDSVCFKIKFFEGQPTKEEVCAVAWRLANMAEWVEKFGNQVRLTGMKRMKWASFDQISVHVLQTLELRPRPTRAHPPAFGAYSNQDTGQVSEYDPSDEDYGD